MLKKNQGSIRVVILFLLMALLLLYFPINQNVKGGITPDLPLDAKIQLIPIWIIPYLLSILWWIVAIIWATAKMDFGRYLHFSVCLVLTIVVSYLIFLIFPTYVIRPTILGDDFLSQLVAYTYGNDQPYNALPSGHAYTTLIISTFWFSWKPKQRYLWISIVIVVILSTLFTKQHYILDPAASAVVVLITYRISAYLVRGFQTPPDTG